MDQSILVLIIVGVFLIVLGGLLWYVSKTNEKLATLIPPEFANRLMDQGDKLIVAALSGVATTETTTDDDLAIAYLTLRGWKVTGSPELGYTAEKDAPPIL